jgi:hypothetical protein
VTKAGRGIVTGARDTVEQSAKATTAAGARATRATRPAKEMARSTAKGVEKTTQTARRVGDGATSAVSTVGRDVLSPPASRGPVWLGVGVAGLAAGSLALRRRRRRRRRAAAEPAGTSVGAGE